MQNQTQHSSNSVTTPPEPFRFTFTNPYDSHVQRGTGASSIRSGWSANSGWSQHPRWEAEEWKSSLSRYLATSVAKGTPFLGRDTEQGDVILVNLEDPLIHLDNCLRALGYDPAEGHGEIHITDRLSPSINETIDALAEALTRFKDVRLIVIDHLANLRVKDLSEYMPVQAGCQSFATLHASFPMSIFKHWPIARRFKLMIHLMEF